MEIIPPQALPHGLAVLFHLLIFIRVAIRLLGDLLISAALETDSMLCRSEKKYLQPFEYFSISIESSASSATPSAATRPRSHQGEQTTRIIQASPSLQAKHRHSKHHDAGATIPSLFREKQNTSVNKVTEGPPSPACLIPQPSGASISGPFFGLFYPLTTKAYTLPFATILAEILAKTRTHTRGEQASKELMVPI